MLVHLVFTLILKKVNIRSIKNGIKELSMTKQELIEKYQKEFEESKERLNKLAKQPVEEYLVKLARTNLYAIRHFIEDLERLD